MPRVVVLLFIALSSVFPIVSAQSVDTLVNVVDENVNDTLLIDSCLILSRELSRKNSLKAFEYAKIALDRSIALKDKSREFDALILQGILFKNLGEYEKAVSNYLLALDIAKLQSHEQKKSVCYNNIGSVYQAQGILDNALEYYKKSLDIEEKFGNKAEISLRYYNIGTVYELKDSLDLAYTYYYNSLLHEQTLNNKEGIYFALYGLSGVDIKRNNYSQAEDHLNKALDIAKELQDDAGVAICLIERGKLYKAQNKLNLAVEDISEGIRYAVKVDFKNEVREAYFQLSDIYAKQNNFQSAFEFQRRFIALNDSLSSVEVNTKIAEIESRYQISEKEKEIEFLVEKEKLLQKQANSEKNHRYFLLITLVITMIFALSNLNRVTKNLSSLLMISGVVFLVVIMLAFFLALFQSADQQMGVDAFFSALLTVFSFAVLPIFLFILIAERIMLAKHEKLAQNVSEKLQTVDKKDDDRSLTLIAENEKDKVDVYLSELLYIEANDNYSAVYFKKHGEVKKQLLRGSLKRMEEQLKTCELVVRCHKSFIVNISKISKVSGNAQGYKLHIPDIDTEIPVSRRFPKEVLQKIRN